MIASMVVMTIEMMIVVPRRIDRRTQAGVRTVSPPRIVVWIVPCVVRIVRAAIRIIPPGPVWSVVMTIVVVRIIVRIVVVRIRIAEGDAKTYGRSVVPMSIAERTRCVERVVGIVIIDDDRLLGLGFFNSGRRYGDGILRSDNCIVVSFFDDDDFVAFCLARISPVITVGFQLRIATTESERTCKSRKKYQFMHVRNARSFLITSENDFCDKMIRQV